MNGTLVLSSIMLALFSGFLAGINLRSSVDTDPVTTFGVVSGVDTTQTVSFTTPADIPHNALVLEDLNAGEIGKLKIVINEHGTTFLVSKVNPSDDLPLIYNLP